MAYAGIAGMPPEAGLYAAPLALIGYAIFGTSKHLNVGPSSTVAALSFSVVAGFGFAVASGEWITTTIILALLTGVILIVAGFLKLGVLADFLSRPVLGGFIVGLAITIAVGQLDKILGYEVEELQFIPDILVLLKDFGMVHWPTFVVGIVSLAALFLIAKYIPKLPGALTVLLLAIAISALLGFEELGIHIVGEIPAGLPPFGFQGASIEQITALIPGALAIAVVAFAESVAAARSYATKFGYKVEANQELIALGAANVGSGFSQGFAVDGSLSKTAAAVEAGAKSQMVSIIAAIAVLITAVFLTPLFYYLPEAVLGAIVIHAVWRLISFHKVQRYWNINRLDFWAALTAMLGVLLFGILEGLILAILVALVGLLIGAKRKSTSILGKVPKDKTYLSLENYPQGKTTPGILILRFDGNLFFANVGDFIEEIHYGIQITKPKPKVILLDFESISDIDATAVETLNELYDELAKDGIKLRFARVKKTVRKVMKADGLEKRIGRKQFYLSVHEGVDYFRAEKKEKIK